MAGLSVHKVGTEIPALVDDIHNSTEVACTARPDRLDVIDRAVRITLNRAPGP